MCENISCLHWAKVFFGKGFLDKQELNCCSNTVFLRCKLIISPQYMSHIVNKIQMLNISVTERIIMIPMDR